MYLQNDMILQCTPDNSNPEGTEEKDMEHNRNGSTRQMFKLSNVLCMSFLSEGQSKMFKLANAITVICMEFDLSGVRVIGSILYILNIL